MNTKTKKMKTNKHKKGKARKYFIKTFIIFKKAYIGKNSYCKYRFTIDMSHPNVKNKNRKYQI